MIELRPYELYVACEARASSVVWRFLETFLPRRRGAGSYELHTADDELVTYDSFEELLEELLDEPDAPYAVYFDREGEGEPRQAMLFFTDDGGLIAGLAGWDTELAPLLEQLARVAGARFGLATSEDRPPDSSKAFIDKCRAWPWLRIVDGQLLLGA